MAKLNKDIILFDLDGTLSDSQEGITKCLQHALKHFGINAELDELKRFIGPPLISGFMEFYGFDGIKAEEAIAVYRERYSKIGIYENRLYDGVEQMLKTLKNSGKIMALATSKPIVYAKRVLEYFKIDGYFCFVGGSELSGERNPKHEVIKYVFDNNRFDKAKTVMVGDRKHDIIGASKNGIDSIGILHGYGSKKELEENGANFIVEDCIALTKLLCKD